MVNEDKFNQVESPDYYNTGKKECIEAMEDEFGTHEVAIFAKLNAFKYMYRQGNKGPADTDIRKAQWYIEKYNQKREPVFQQHYTLGDISALVEKYRPAKKQ